MPIAINDIRNARSLNAENTRFYVELKHPIFDWIPYSLDPDDKDETIDNDNILILIGDNYEPYIAPTQEELDNEAAQDVRNQRDFILQKTVDAIVGNPLRWGDLTEEQQNAWKAYRTALLNISDQPGFPHNVTWPTSPEST